VRLIASLLMKRTFALERPEGAARTAALKALDKLIVEVAAGTWPRTSSA
jgi:hypothetical protein